MTTPNQSRVPQPGTGEAAAPAALGRSASWFTQARLGAEFHWGPAAMLGAGENALFHQALPLAEYQALAEAWEPEAFEARAWAEAARAGGLRYVIFPARASDGFCLWRTATTSFCSVHSGAGRDYLAEFIVAAREAGLKIGVSFSLADWSDATCLTGPNRATPAAWAAFTSKVAAQFREILTGYGALDLVQFAEPGGLNAEQWRAAELVAMVRQWQPEALLSYAWPLSQVKGGTGWPHPDIATVTRPDFKQPGFWQTPGLPYTEFTEHGWRETMSQKEACASEAALLDLAVNAAMAGGNLLLQLSPDGRGIWPVPVRGALRELGRWLETHGESIYGTGRVRYQAGLRHTRRGRVLYLHFAGRATWAWDAEKAEYAFHGLPEQVHSAFLVGSPGRRLNCEWSVGGIARVRGLPAPGSREWGRPGGVVGLRLAPEA